MNVLFYRYGSICEPDLIDAFKEYGLSVYTVDVEITDKNILPNQRVDMLSRLLLEKDYAFIFSINFFPDISNVCNICRIPYMCLVVDSPVLELFSDQIKNPCNRIFLFDRQLYNDFSPYNPDCIFYIPLATNVARWDKAIAAAKPDDFASDVSFVGSMYTEKCAYDNLNIPDDYTRGTLEGIIEAQLKVYGYYFVDELMTDELAESVMESSPAFYRFAPGCREDYKAVLSQLYIGTKISALERVRTMQMLASHFHVDIYTGSDTSIIPGIHNHGLVTTHTQMPLVFNHSRINLNITSRSIRTGMPLRIFDVLGCGGFLITNYQSDLSDCFVPGEHLLVYSSPEELYELVRYYREHDKERIEIARNGYEEVRDHHNYIVRVGQMITTAFGGNNT